MLRNRSARDGERRKLTRRGFGHRLTVLLGAGALAKMGQQTALASDPAFSLAVIPDPQYLPARCSSLYSGIMNWCITNQSSYSITGGGSLATNIQAVLGVGDCVNLANTGEASTAQTAWGILDTNGVPWGTCAGNHDYVNGGTAVVRSDLATNFQTGGFFASDTRAGKSYWGTAFHGGTPRWGGYNDSSNYYFTIWIGSRKLLFLFLDFQPSTPTLTWAKSIHDSHPGYECIILTHSYLTDTGNWCTTSADPAYSAITFQGNGQYNTDDYSLNQTNGLATGGNVGYRMWNNFLTTWTNVTMVLCGHRIYAAFHNAPNSGAGPNPSWYWQRVPVTSTSTRTQTVQQMFVNSQELDNPGGGYCGDGTTDAGHLFLLKWPGDGTVEGYQVSVNTNKWTGLTDSVNNASPVRLFSVAYPGVPRVGLFPMPSPLVQ